GAGPFGSHFFMSYGLLRNAFIGTFALGTLMMQVAKAGTYTRFALLDARALGIAVLIGLTMAVGAYIGGRLVRHVPDRLFVYVVEGVMTVAGILLIL
ncbi:MAG: hypothetical protein WD645_06605, partial [Dehalococcoidia bacterium]